VYILLGVWPWVNVGAVFVTGDVVWVYAGAGVCRVSAHGVERRGLLAVEREAFGKVEQGGPDCESDKEALGQGEGAYGDE